MGRTPIHRTANVSLIEDIVNLLYAWGQDCFSEITPDIDGKFFKQDTTPEEDQNVEFMFKVLAPSQIASYDKDSAGIRNSWLLYKKFSIAIEITSRFLYSTDSFYDGCFMYEQRFSKYVEQQKQLITDMYNQDESLYSVYKIASSIQLIESGQISISANEDCKTIAMLYETLPFNMLTPTYAPNNITMQQFILEFVINQSQTKK